MPEPEEKQAMMAIVGPVDVDQLAAAFKAFEDFKNRLLTADDIVTIQNRRVVKRSGWAKWRLACNVSDRVLEQKRTPETGVDQDGQFSWRVVTEVYHIPTGRASVGVAIASTSEKKSWSHVEHDVYTLAATRSKNRATSDLIGGGEVSAEELDTTDQGLVKSDTTTGRPKQ